MSQTELLFISSSEKSRFLLTCELAKLIVKTNPGISIHVIIYHMPNESTDAQTWFDFFLREVVQDRITFITLPLLSNQQESFIDDFFPTPIHRQKPLIKRAIVDRVLKPSAIVVDLVSISMTDVAKELQIPFYIYFTSGTSYLNTLFQLQSLADEQGINGFTELASNLDTELDLIGFQNPVPVKVLPRRVLNMPWAMIHLAREFRAAKGILVNSFMELEPLTINALHEQDNIPTIYPVGPILALQQYDDHAEDEVAIMRWLDEQPHSSVVFLYFGTDVCFDVDQAKEIVNGLDRSGYRFLLTIRLTSDPEHFMDRTAHNGKTVSWAPEVKVLAHQAIRGCVSHCEWTSILTSIWFGVPIATWPISSEQQLNAFTLVRELGLATEISLDYRWDCNKQTGNNFVTSEEVEEGVKILMATSCVDKMCEMSRGSRHALQPNDGSSYKCLLNFVNEIVHNIDFN